MFAIVQHASLCAFASLATLVVLAVQALRPRHARFERNDADVTEEIRLMAEADQEAKYLATPGPR